MKSFPAINGTAHFCLDFNFNSSLVSVFKDIFSAHGALGYRDLESYQKIQFLSEWDKLCIVPLIFSMLPSKALREEYSGNKVKPLIQEHLRELEVQDDARLIEILKRIVDQYAATDINSNSDRFIRKMGISDLRSNRSLYKKISFNQNRRCAVCGSRLGIDCKESLDHIIPFRLIGDVIDGSNWQILCEPCNRGKRDFLSSLQSLEAMNWLYGRNLSNLNTPSEEGRYVTFMRMKKCSHSSCLHTSKTASLFIKQHRITGLAVPVHMEVVCEMHYDLLPDKSLILN
jgi:5-methylcytosine-specific restriction endonuclease McrA